MCYNKGHDRGHKGDARHILHVLQGGQLVQSREFGRGQARRDFAHEVNVIKPAEIDYQRRERGRGRGKQGCFEKALKDFGRTKVFERL